jgi:UPF0271 protein
MTEMRAVDVNIDAGEGQDDAAMMPFVTSVSVACGGHIGDRSSMEAAVTAANRHAVRVGAHPSYPDLVGFGRRALDMPDTDLLESLVRQVSALRGIAAEVGVVITHVKAHGALYNLAWRDRATAELVAQCALRAAPGAALFGPPGSALIAAAAAHGISTVAEVFLDRRYAADGMLQPRTSPGALISDAAGLDEQLAYLRTMDFRTACLHSDNPAVLQLLVGLRPLLRNHFLTATPYVQAA